MEGRLASRQSVAAPKAGVLRSGRGAHWAYTRRVSRRTQYHFLDGSASDRVRSLIAERADAIWDLVTRPGGGGPLDCLTVRNLWVPEFEMAGILVLLQGRTGDIAHGLPEQGGYLVACEAAPRDHHWLVVDDNLALFDPTARRPEFGIPSLNRYWVTDTLPFECWRAERGTVELAAAKEIALLPRPVDTRSRLLRRRSSFGAMGEIVAPALPPRQVGGDCLTGSTVGSDSLVEGNA